MSLEYFNKASRPSLRGELSQKAFDLLVIGGGITGASIFRDAALRGLKTALLEARDFGSGTSSRSSKLIHGGLRYLRRLGLRLAWESCQERNLHIRLNKRLVRPVAFLMPHYQGQGRSPAVTRIGMLLYEVLSGFSNHRFHRFLKREEVLSMAPGLPIEGLLGGCRYYDAAVSDNRWTLETVKDGVRQGGIALNYAPAIRLIKQNHTVAGARFRDAIGGAEGEIRARAVINATGVFVDGIRRLDDPGARPLVRLSKGTHLVFKEDDVPLAVTTVFASPVDGRPLFLHKRDGCFLFGTTDDWEPGPPEAPLPGQKDVTYLLESLRRFLPEAGLNRDKVQFLYSGFRPLLASPSARGGPAAATREDLIEEAPSGLISVVGGKLTTARRMAARALDRVIDRLGPRPSWRPCSTHKLSLGGTNSEVAEGLARWVKRCPPLAGYFRILHDRYGVDAGQICAEAMRIELGRREDPETEPIRAEVEYVCRHEMVCTVEDLLERRAGFLYWSPERRLERLRYGENLIQRELGLTEEEFEAQFRDYREHLARFHSLPAGSG